MEELSREREVLAAELKRERDGAVERGPVEEREAAGYAARDGYEALVQRHEQTTSKHKATLAAYKAELKAAKEDVEVLRVAEI